jgi:hypothetical protein
MQVEIIAVMERQIIHVEDKGKSVGYFGKFIVEF